MTDLETRENHAEQAARIWPMLALAARTHQILSYKDVEGFTGIPRYGQGGALGLIHRYCEFNKFPHLNFIVVEQESRLLGHGAPKIMTAEELLTEQAEILAFDWTSKPKPRAEDFERLQLKTFTVAPGNT